LKTLIVIPARLASTRLPRKLLLNETGRTLIEHTYAAAQTSQLAGEVIVAGDDQEIFDAVTGFDMAIRMLADDSAAVVSTLATPIGSREQLEDPACVKVVMDDRQRALYFSRSPIPCAKVWSDDLLESDPPVFYQHIGLYAYRREFLAQYSGLKRSPLEEIESLEQLRILQAGETISVGLIGHPVVGIDTAKDYELFVSRQKNC